MESYLKLAINRVATCTLLLPVNLNHLCVLLVQGGTPLWKFLDFVVTVRMPLFVMLKPFIQFKVGELLFVVNFACVHRL